MVFVNYGGGRYWFFKHESWNGEPSPGNRDTQMAGLISFTPAWRRGERFERQRYWARCNAVGGPDVGPEWKELLVMLKGEEKVSSVDM